MQKITSILFSFCLVVTLAACASVTKDIKVDAEAVPDANLQNYKTYAWLGSAQIVVDTIGKWEPPGFDTDEVVREFIDRELQARDMRLVEAGPDIFVAFAAGVDMDVLELKVDPDTKRQMFESIPQGALVIVLIDAATDKPVWVGAATANIAESPSDEVVRKRLDYAVTEIFSLMPNAKKESESGY